MANIKELFKNIHKPTRERVLRFIRDTFFVLIGTFILAIGTELFIIPAGLVTGGVSGIAVIFQYANIMIDAEVLIAIISWTLFFIGLLFLGWRFSLQTLCSTITYPVFLIVIKYISKGLPFLLIENATSLVGNVAMIQFLSSVFGGFFVGAGCAITFLGGGSTGGLDIITFILCKFIKVIESSSCIFVIDALVVIIGFIVNKDHDIALCLEGVLSAFIASLVIDKVFQGNTKSYVAYVITDKYDGVCFHQNLLIVLLKIFPPVLLKNLFPLQLLPL